MVRLLFFILSPLLVFAEMVDPVIIGQKYATGVVKIILYDDDLVDDFKLTDDQGQLARGSGFFVSPDGLIFTNRHVVEWCVNGYVVVDWVDENGQEHKMDILTYKPGLEKEAAIKKVYYGGHTTPVIQVFTDAKQTDYQLYLAQVVAMGETFDGAILETKVTLKGEPLKKPFVALPFGNSDDVVLGERLVVLGFPSQYANANLSMDLRDTLTLSQGANSGWDYIFDPDWGMIKTDAAIHEGNSGGPVFGAGNRVIGIATALGVQTEIGLIGPIDAMYWVAKVNPQVFDKLTRLGLTKPKREVNGKAVSGKQVIMPFDRSTFINPLTNQPIKN